MKLKVLGIALACICMCFLLTGCGNNENTATADNAENKTEQQATTNTSEEANKNTTTNQNDVVKEETTPYISEDEKKRRKMADTWMSMPENVDFYWRMDVKSSNEYSITEEYKRGNNGMSYWVEELNEEGKLITPENDGVTNEYYYYHFLGDYKWKAYVYNTGIGFDSWNFNGNYPASPQIYVFGKPWNILNKYSNEHETIKIEGVGEVDTVKGVDDEGYTYYYSKDLNMNVKIENDSQIWCLTRFDTKVSSSFPRALPDMNAVDAKAAKEAEERAKNVNSSNKKTVDYYEDENGEIVLLDD